MDNDRYNNFMVNVIILLSPIAVGIWLSLGLMKLIY